MQINSAIILYYSSNGYGNPLSFKEVEDDDVEQVEHSMKTTNPSFKFRPGDRKLIKSVVDHVKHIVDGNGKCKGLAYFNDQNNQTTKISTEEKVIKKFGEHQSRTHFFLSKLLATADQNANRNKHGYRFNDPELNMYAAYLRMISGPLAYETIQRNLECALPSLVSINRYINASNCRLNEGILRTEELRLFLTERSLQPIVILSEDATRITGRVQYDKRSNQLVGFVLPLNSANGLPIPFKYPARNAEEILNHFSGLNEVATFMNVIMAQPLANVPPFCLTIFGSNNKYSAKDVVQRWNYIVDELTKVGIKVLVISSDSDPRYNKAMRDLSGLGNKTQVNWFSSNEKLEGPFYVQDPTHIGTKMRNFFLSTLYASRTVPFGNYFIDLGHLHTLMENFSKDQHLLTPSILNPLDRQNFNSVLRICNERVTILLKDAIKNSDGTYQYLQIMRDVISSFIDPNITPLQRIRKMWYSVFLIRMWRESIVTSKKYTLKENFMSGNCYSCIELNAHELVKCLLHLREIDKPEFFCPHLFESQACESTFRQLRSFTTTYSTVINCSLKESISRVFKIHLQNEIVHSTSTHFVYPRAKNSSTQTVNYKLPTKEEIFKEIEFCKKLAEQTAVKLGLIARRNKNRSFYPCRVRPNVEAKQPQSKSKPQTSSINVRAPPYELKFSDLKNIQLKNYARDVSSNAIDAASSYVEVVCDDGKRVVVKKTSLCWLLGPDCRKMSSDRLLRVKYSTSTSISKPKSKSKQKLNKHFIRSVLKSCDPSKRKYKPEN